MCVSLVHSHHLAFFFFNDTATTEIYTLSLHDALPIFEGVIDGEKAVGIAVGAGRDLLPVRFRLLLDPHRVAARPRDRKSTRLNSSHLVISYAVFCLKKKTRSSSTMSSP